MPKGVGGSSVQTPLARFGRACAVAVALAGVALVAAAQSGAAAPRVSARAHLPAPTAFASPSLRAAFSRNAGGPCPPNPVYPTSLTDQTQYLVPVSAAVLNGTANAGYNEDTGGPGTRPIPPGDSGNIYFPWLFHLTGLTATATVCAPLPSLNLPIQPSQVHVNTYGILSGGPPSATLGPHASTTYKFQGVADPGSQRLMVFVAGTDTGGVPNAGFAALYYKTHYYAHPAVSPLPPLSLSNEVVQCRLSCLSGKTCIVVNCGPQQASSTPGAIVAPSSTYTGTVVLTNTTGVTINSIEGTEAGGFVTGPNTLAPGQSGTYNFDFYISGNVSFSGWLTLSFRGLDPTGVPVYGFGVAYVHYTNPTIALQVSNVTINGVPATTPGQGPVLQAGSVFNGQMTVTNNQNIAVSGLNGNTNQQAALSVSVGQLSGYPQYPSQLTNFTLTVTLAKPAVGTVLGVRPDALGRTPFGGIDATATATATGVFTATNPVLTCGQNVTATATTGTSTVVPSYPGQPARTPGPQWTMSGLPIVGPLYRASGQVISNSAPLLILPSQACLGGQGAPLFDQDLGGVRPNGQFYNPTGNITIGGQPGEVQVRADALVASVVGVPVCDPSPSTPVTCTGG